jgi:gamma-glutamylaminecyclotransferase
MHRIFVYGTLKKGFANYDEDMLGPYFVARCRSVKAYPLVICTPWRSPALLPEAGEGHRVRGELYEVDDDLLAHLDELESTHLATGYERQLIDIEDGAGNDLAPAWAYFKPRQLIEAVLDGPFEDYPLDASYVTIDKR